MQTQKGLTDAINWISLRLAILIAASFSNRRVKGIFVGGCVHHFLQHETAVLRLCTIRKPDPEKNLKLFRRNLEGKKRRHYEKHSLP